MASTGFFFFFFFSNIFGILEAFLSEMKQIVSLI